MNWVRRNLRPAGIGALGALLAAGLLLSGCGMPGAPLPPTLDLPVPVTDLTASRAGEQVSLAWTMPKKNTDKLLLTGNVQALICHRDGTDNRCMVAGQLQQAPGAQGVFIESLPQELSTGMPRPLTYFVELKNRNGRAAGFSNGAVVLAGEAPSPVEGLEAEVKKAGVVLSWNADAHELAPTAIRLHRKLLTPQPEKKNSGQQEAAGRPLAPQAEPAEQNLLVEANPQTPVRALDKSIHFGETYEYRAQRVARVDVGAKTMELDGEFSAPLHVDVADVFPPAVPEGLAAVAIAGENGGAPAIDLSWQPGTETDLAGYIVYRREGTGGWQRISPAGAVVGPAFRDAHVEAGHSYSYVVSAVDQGGHESGRSGEAQETVPGP